MTCVSVHNIRTYIHITNGTCFIHPYYTNTYLFSEMSRINMAVPRNITRKALRN